jgi:DNA-directed RNA polymerase subunit beta'
LEFNVFESIKIGLASPIRLDPGLTVKLKTRNHQLQNPQTERDGFVCERIFGPMKGLDATVDANKRIRYKGRSASAAALKSRVQKCVVNGWSILSWLLRFPHIWYLKAHPRGWGCAQHDIPVCLRRFCILLRILS